jgi:hypothetical protein
VVRARRQRAVIFLIVALIAIATAGATFILVGDRVVDPAVRTALDADAKGIASALESAARAAHVRADRIATHDMVRAAVQTDAATATDMMQSDFDHTPIKDEKLIKGETLELFQIAGGKPVSLARMPATAPALQPLDGHGTRVALAGDGLAMLVSSPVQRFKDGPGYKPVDGSLVMAIPVDLAFARQQAARSAVAAQLTGLDKPVALIANPDASGPDLSIPIESKELGTKLQLSVVPKTTIGRASWVAPVRYAGLALGVLLLVVAGLTLRAPR